MRISDWSSDVCSSDLFEEKSRFLEQTTSKAKYEEVLCKDGVKHSLFEGVWLCIKQCPYQLPMAIRFSTSSSHLQSTCVTKIGRAHVCTPVTNSNLVCRLLLEKKHYIEIKK